MKTISVPVRSDGAIVTNADVNVYDSVDEAVEHQGEESILELINVQSKTSAMNTARIDAGGGPKSVKKDELLDFICTATAEQVAEVTAAKLAKDDKLVVQLMRKALGI